MYPALTIIFFITTSLQGTGGPEQWSNTKSYTHTTAVLDANGDTYLTVQDVSPGILLSNTDYWTLIDEAVPKEEPEGQDLLEAPNLSTLPNYTPDGVEGTSTENARLTNISTRGYVGTGDSSMIVSFIIEGSGSKTVTIRALGPVLASFGVADALSDPFLSVTNQETGAELVSNDNWQTASSASAVTSSGKSEGIDAKESAVQLTLEAGQYSAVVTGVNGATGNALVEVYDED